MFRGDGVTLFGIIVQLFCISEIRARGTRSIVRRKMLPPVPRYIVYHLGEFAPAAPKWRRSRSKLPRVVWENSDHAPGLLVIYVVLSGCTF